MRDFFITVSILASWLIVLEGGIRIAGEQRPDMYIYLHDGLRDWAFPPHAEGWATTDEPLYVHFNAEGFNDRDHPLVGRPGTVRIAVVGDSMTAETMIPKESIYTSILERELPGTEVFNFGVNAYNTEQCRRLLQDVVWKYKPQIVLFLLTFQSGIAYNLRELGYSDNSSAPYLIFRDGKLVPDERTSRMARFGPARIAWEESFAALANRSRIVLLGYRAWLKAEQKFRRPKPLTENMVRNINLRPYIPEVDSDMIRAWKVSEALINALRDDVESHGAQFLVAVPGLPMQTDPDLSAREAFKKKIGVTSLYDSNDKLRELCRRDRLRLIDLAKPMSDYAAAHSVSLYGFGPDLHGGHWNEQGNLAAGRILARELRDIVTGCLK